MKSPVAGEVKTRLAPPLDAESARDLYAAFLKDLFARVGRSKFIPTIFFSGDGEEAIRALAPPRWPLAAQTGAHLGERMKSAFDHLLAVPGSRAVIIGSDSPDLPLAHVKSAFGRLKHRDVVIGPAADGGYYLIGLRAPAPALFEGIEWGTASVFDRTVEAIERSGLTLSLLPVWYDVDDGASLALLEALCRARRLAGARLLPHTEAMLAARARRRR